MFFPKLRSQAKWMFVFLALTFAIGFVAFGVGAAAAAQSLWEILGVGGSSGPSVSDAQKKINKGDLAAYKELADAYRQDKTSTRRSPPASSISGRGRRTTSTCARWRATTGPGGEAARPGDRDPGG